MIVDSTRKRSAFRPGALILLGISVLLAGAPCRSQQTVAGRTNGDSADTHSIGPSTPTQQTEPQRSGTVSGTVIDQSGVPITGALVKLVRAGESAGTEIPSDESGQFFFPDLAPGQFHLTIACAGLAPQEFSGNLDPGQAFVTPLFRLMISTQVTEVHVGLTPTELADVQIQDQEKQRVFGFISNGSLQPRPSRLQKVAGSLARPLGFLGVGRLAPLLRSIPIYPNRLNHLRQFFPACLSALNQIKPGGMVLIGRDV